MRLLLARGADFDAEDEARSARRVGCRLQTRAEEARAAAHQDGCTPLHLAAVAGHTDAVSLLLESSDVDAEDASGNTPAWAAFAAAKTSVARLLIQDGGGDVNAVCEEGRTYLHSAAARNASDDVAWLLQHGAAVNAKDMVCDAPLHVAAAAGAWGCARTLVGAGAAVNARGKARTLPALCSARLFFRALTLLVG